MAGCAVPAETAIPEGFNRRNVPAGTYAVFTHCGPVSGIGRTVDFACRAWLPDSSCELRDGPDIELFDRRFEYESQTSECEYWLPVRRQTDRPHCSGPTVDGSGGT